MRARIIFAAATCAGLLACGASGPSKELKTARDTYNRARVSSAAQYSPTAVLEAKQALDTAESIHKNDPGSDVERSYSYIATRRAEEAMVLGDLGMARRDKEMSDQRYLTLQEEIRTKQEQELAQARGTGAELERERAARMAAEARAKSALESLERSGSIKEEQRGTVITLSGQVLFRTGEDELLPAAREKLAEVASVLVASGDDRQILVEGHTDSQGAADMNQKLSERRAESVKRYLVSQGVPEERILTEGKGETTPIANNDSPEGRANNRRVEIVMARKDQPSSMPQGTTPEGTSPEGTSPEGTSPEGATPQNPNMPREQMSPPGGTTPQQGTTPERRAPRSRQNKNR